MTLRQAMSRNKGISIAIAIVLIGGGVTATVVQIRPPAAPVRSSRCYFIDEDKTDLKDLFADDKELIPPFEHGGKQAVRAHVYVVNGQKTIGYLEKASDEFKKGLEKGLEQQKAATSGVTKGTGQALPLSVKMKMNPFGTLVKRPGDREWVGVKSGGRYAQIVAISNSMQSPEVSPEP